MKGERRILSRTTLACSTDITVVAPNDRVTRPAVVGSTVVSLTFARCSVELAAAQPPHNSHTAGACSSQLIVSIQELMRTDLPIPLLLVFCP